MAVFEVALEPVPTELIDPHYEDRHALSVENDLSHPAILLGRLAHTERFSQPLGERHRLSKWPEHRPGELPLGITIDRSSEIPAAKYEIPDELAQFGEAIGLVAAHEHAAYPGATYEKIMVEARQSFVDANTSQNGTPAFHRDQLLGYWKHIYMISDAYPTIFDPCAPVDPYQIVFSNGTTLHSSPIFPESRMRTFLRIMYTHDLTEN